MRTTLPVHPIDLEPFRTGGPPSVGRSRSCSTRRAATPASSWSPVTVSRSRPATPRSTRSARSSTGPSTRSGAVVVDDPSANRGYSALGEEGLVVQPRRGDARATCSRRSTSAARTPAASTTSGTVRSTHPTHGPPSPATCAPRGASTTAPSPRSPTPSSRRWRSRSTSPSSGSSNGASTPSSPRAPSTTSAAPSTPDPVEGQMRMGAHTDYGILTVLLADDVPGLQVFRDGVWHDVSTPRGAFVCNLGDMLARWTNDRWISTLHRVVPPPRRQLGPGAPSIDRPLPRLPTRPRGRDHPVVRRRRAPGRATNPCNAGEWLRAKVLGSRALQLQRDRRHAVSTEERREHHHPQLARPRGRRVHRLEPRRRRCVLRRARLRDRARALHRGRSSRSSRSSSSVSSSACSWVSCRSSAAPSSSTIPTR